MTELIVSIIRLIVDLVGHEEAHRLVSAETERRANELADAVAKARGLI